MMPTKTALKFDSEEIVRAIDLMFNFDSVIELRALKVPRSGTVSGYFDTEHREDLIKAASELSGKAPGVYLTLNPVDFNLLARASNRAKPFAESTTKDNEILCRRFLPIDFDPKRPSGISSTESEHRAAMDRALECRSYLRERKWPEPLYADSGNGAHLLYRIDLPNDQASTVLIKRILASLATRFSDLAVDVDPAVFNPARIWKLYGTLSAKGDHTPDRPHRIARILETPDSLEVVDLRLLEAVAGTPNVPSANGKVDDEIFRNLTTSGRTGNLDVEKWLIDHGVEFVRKEPWNGGTKWILSVCPWNPDHTGSNKAMVGQLPNGKVIAKCQHASCSDKKWHDMRDLYEPGWRTDQTDVKPVEAVNDPHRLARHYLESECSHPEGPTLHFYNGEWYRWDGFSYREEPTAELDARLTNSIKGEFDRENVEAQRRKDDRRAFARPVTAGIINNVRLVMRGAVLVPSSSGFPCWIGEGPWDAADVLPARNGLFHIPSLMEGVDSHKEPTPRFFSTFALDYKINHEAPIPDSWLQFLDQLWDSDQQSKDTLQEFMGYFLTPDTSQQKILMLVGQKRSGKSVIANVIRGMIGSDNVAGTTLTSLRGSFGLQTLLGKSLTIVPDARLRGQTDTVMERLLSISGEDTLTVERKHLPSVNVKLPTRLLLVSNELPRFDDASGALASRMILLGTNRSFLGKEDPTLTDRLLTERAGILLWALAGLKRLRERRRFVQPESAMELVRELEDLSSPVGQFVRECCEVGPFHEVSKGDLYEAYTEWCGRNGRKFPESQNVFGRNLFAIVPNLTVTQPRSRGERQRHYVGIALATR